MKSRRATLSAALIVLVCFFLPWIHVSCASIRDTATGIDLAREGDHALWLIPILMLLLLFYGSVQAWKDRQKLTLITLVSGLVSTYLMNRERLKVDNSTGLIQVGLTGWFWLGLGASIALVALAASSLLTRRRSV
jgi:hypothetical protein